MMYFIWEKISGIIFPLENLVLMSHNVFLKILGEDILMGPAVAFISGPGK